MLPGTILRGPLRGHLRMRGRAGPQKAAVWSGLKNDRVNGNPDGEPCFEARLRRAPQHEEGGMSAFVYMLRCSDGSYYVGSARDTSLDRRLSEHQSGHFGGYTSLRRPVGLVYHEHFDQITDAIAAERRIKGWSRAKKEALIRSDWAEIQHLAKRPNARASTHPHPEVLPEAASKDATKPAVLRGPASPGTSA
jgi:putative endonuclease